MTTAHYIVGDTRDVTAMLPDGCIDLVLTSPPFLALRSYLPADHPDKHREIGSEATPAAFLDVLFGLTAEWGRVLAPHGSIAIELGDTYSGSTMKGGGALGGSWVSTRSDDHDRRGVTEGWPLAKSLTLIPELYRIALAYGTNPLTGAPSPAGRWRVRNVVRWHRPNPPVGALGDKYRPATTDMVIATRAKDRWFDLDAVRGPYSDNSHPRTAKDVGRQTRTAKTSDDGNRATLDDVNNDGRGAPPLDTWTIPTHPYKGAHYATWPPALCEIPIKSMCPMEVCVGCGTPRRRITEQGPLIDREGNAHEPTDRRSGEFQASGSAGKTDGGLTRESLTLGWTVCGCPTPTYRPGLVLDPFAGTGTTLAVATGHGRNAIGIDIDPRNLELAYERIGGLMLTHGACPPEWLR